MLLDQHKFASQTYFNNLKKKLKLKIHKRKFAEGHKKKANFRFHTHNDDRATLIF